MNGSTQHSNRPRVFGIGLNKTGTVSFHEAMGMLGMKSLHWGGPEIHWRVVAAREGNHPLLWFIDQGFDAFSDIGVLSRSFAELDKQYPGSRFVLTVRDRDEWLDSRLRHVTKNVQLKEAGEYHGDFLVVDEEKWRREWDQHLERVHRYFDGRDDFLEIDITAGAGWAPFCKLLDVAEPSEAFPWGNRYKDPPPPEAMGGR